MSSLREKKNSGISVIFLLGVALLVALDQVTKYLARSLEQNGPRILWEGVLEFRYLENRGAAFSMLQGRQGFFYVLTVVFLIALVLVLRRMPAEKKYLPMRLCLLFLAAGAIGNLIDRVVQKYVVDFIYFSLIDFPIFNVADIYVTVSVAVLVLLFLFYYSEDELAFLSRKRAKKHDEGGPEDG